ncbi:MAG: GIY-YIG nuclease family protein [Pseudomonadota bacterium]
MSTDDRKKRLSVLSHVPSIAAIDHRLLLYKDGKHPLLSQLPRKERRKLEAQSKKMVKKYSSILKTTQRSGAGFPVDKLLRSFAIEYTHRYASSGLENQPISFNYIESFCDIRLIKNSFAPYAVPIKEVDHLFNITDYFDYLTSDKTDNFDLASLMDLPEGKALHFTANGDVLDFSFLNAEGREFVISGFSMVRRSNLLHWYLLGGEIITDDEWALRKMEQGKFELKNMNPLKRAFLSESMDEHGYNMGAPIALEGTDTAIRTVIAGEINLITNKYQGRCLMIETEHSFSVITDDPEMFDQIRDNDDRRNMINIMKERIANAAVMWDLVGSMFQLPSYFAYKVKIKKDVAIAAGRRVRKIKSKGGRGIDGNYNIVSAIDIIDSDSPVIRPVMPPHYKTETEGHWRRLPHGTTGRGPDGSDELNRTWVKSKSKWRESNKKSRIIYVKSTVKAAELKAIEYEKAAQAYSANIITDDVGIKPEYGELYVLRCTVMKDQLYKVGWTSGSSQSRAEQLSSATGVPTSFVVVDCWKHKDAEALEKSVHAMLEPYRVNDRREFFQVNYRSIKKIIEAEIQRSDSKRANGI